MAERAIEEVAEHNRAFPQDASINLSVESICNMIYAIESLKHFVSTHPNLPFIEYALHLAPETRKFAIIQSLNRN